MSLWLLAKQSDSYGERLESPVLELINPPPQKLFLDTSKKSTTNVMTYLHTKYE